AIGPDGNGIATELFQPVIHLGVMSTPAPGIVMVDDRYPTFSQSLGFQYWNLLAKSLSTTPSGIVVHKAIVGIRENNLRIKDRRANSREPVSPPACTAFPWQSCRI